MSRVPKKIRRRRRGRPPRDYSADPDLAVAELAIALQAAWDRSERQALDLALAWWGGGELGRPSKIPRGGKAGRLGSYALPAGKSFGLLVSYALPAGKSFASRNANIRLKLRNGKLRPRAEVVLCLAKVLHPLRSRRR
jgi:hypothetical protein